MATSLSPIAGGLCVEILGSLLGRVHRGVRVLGGACEEDDEKCRRSPVRKSEEHELFQGPGKPEDCHQCDERMTERRRFAIFDVRRCMPT